MEFQGLCWVFACLNTVPLKGKLTVPQASILDPRNSETSSFESRVKNFEVRVSSLESRKIMSLSLE